MQKITRGTSQPPAPICQIQSSRRHAYKHLHHAADDHHVADMFQFSSACHVAYAQKHNAAGNVVLSAVDCVSFMNDPRRCDSVMSKDYMAPPVFLHTKIVESTDTGNWQICF